MLKQKILDFLYDQVQKGMIPHIKKGMAEEFEQFVSSVLENQQVRQAADRMVAKTSKENPEKESKDV